MSKKPNPRRIPCSQADVDRAKEQATAEATWRAVYIMLYVLVDKLGFRDEMATKAWMLFNRTIEQINSGKLKWQQIAEVLKEEYGYEIEDVL